LQRGAAPGPGARCTAMSPCLTLYNALGTARKAAHLARSASLTRPLQVGATSSTVNRQVSRSRWATISVVVRGHPRTARQASIRAKCSTGTGRPIGRTSPSCRLFLILGGRLADEKKQPRHKPKTAEEASAGPRKALASDRVPLLDPPGPENLALNSGRKPWRMYPQPPGPRVPMVGRRLPLIGLPASGPQGVGSKP